MLARQGGRWQKREELEEGECWDWLEGASEPRESRSGSITYVYLAGRSEGQIPRAERHMEAETVGGVTNARLARRATLTHMHYGGCPFEFDPR